MTDAIYTTRLQMSSQNIEGEVTLKLLFDKSRADLPDNSCQNTGANNWWARKGRRARSCQDRTF